MEDRVQEVIGAIKTAREHLPAVRYNSKMLAFMCRQLEKAEAPLCGLPREMQPQDLSSLIEEADAACLLVKSHAEVFKVRKFYHVDDVQAQIESICCRFAEWLPRLSVMEAAGIETRIDDECVEEDRRYMHWYLTCILEGRHVAGLEEGARQELESQIAEQQQLNQFLKFIPDQEVDCRGELGAGGFGKVFVAHWRDNPVAVKKLEEELSPEARAEVITEVEIHLRMEHPNVVRCFGITTRNGIVMELATMDLERYLQERRQLSWEIRINLMKSAAAGLRYLHDQSVVHRDIKSCNFLVFDAEGSGCPTIKIGDFGLAMAKTETRSKTAMPPMGTPLWWAPEIHDGHPHSFRSDVFSFGLLLCELASGCLPYKGITNDALLLGRKKHERDPCTVPESCPQLLVGLIKSCIKANSSRRPTMADVDDQLKQILSDVQVHA